MDVDGLWALIEQSEQQTTLRAERVAWLEERLSALPAEEIVDFAGWWTLAANRGCTWDMCAVYWFLMGSGSSDGFDYFVSWLIGLGREAFEMVADCPDAALEAPQVQHVLELQRSFARDRANRSRGGRRVMWTREEWPEFELFPVRLSRAVQESDRPGRGQLVRHPQCSGNHEQIPFAS